jgi:hypothetical protein
MPRREQYMNQADDVFEATIVITSQNRELRQLCRSFIPSTVPVFIVDGSNRCYGMRAIKYVIETVPCDRVILLDEDAFILNFTRLRRLLTWTANTDTACIGMGDGGVVSTRTHNPNALNPFFNIIALNKVRQKWNETTCRAYMAAGCEMCDLWAPNGVTAGVAYQFDDFEPYYCFYFWLWANGFKMEWLTARTHADGVSTLLNDRHGKPFLLHAWYGREFGHDPDHTERIGRAALWAAAHTESDEPDV